MTEQLFVFNQTNSCTFVKEFSEGFYDQFCENEMNFFDGFEQHVAFIAILALLLGLILATYGCGFYDLPEDGFNQNMEYKEMELS